MRTLTIPNLLSVARMALVPLFVVCILDGNVGRALWVFAAAGVSDALDGFIARVWRQQSALGLYLDPAADKLLLVCAYVVLAIPNLHAGYTIPAWISALVVTRDIVIVVVALTLYLAAGIKRFPPSPISKINTLLQVVAVILVLFSGVLPHLEIAAAVSVHLVAALTFGSGLDYIHRTNRISLPRG